MSDSINHENQNNPEHAEEIYSDGASKETSDSQPTQEQPAADSSFQPSDSNMQESAADEFSSEQSKADSMAIASLVLGIVSIAFGWWAYVSIICLVLGIVGLVLGVKARKENPTGIATGGMVTSIIGICLSGVFLACVLTAATGLACIGVLGGF